MARATEGLLRLCFIVTAAGCAADDAPPPETAPVAVTSATPSPPADPDSTVVPQAKTPDLAARCDAVDWNGPRDRDHLPPGLRAIANELTARGPSCIPEIEEALPLSLNLRRTAPDALLRWPSDKTRAILVRQLDDPDEQASHHAAWALGVIGGREVVQPLLDAANKPDSLVREQVLGAMRTLPAGTADAAYDLIASSLSDRRSWNRTVAADALAYVVDARKRADAVALAEKAVESESHEGVKAALQRSIAVLRAKK